MAYLRFGSLLNILLVDDALDGTADSVSNPFGSFTKAADESCDDAIGLAYISLKYSQHPENLAGSK